MMNIQYLNPDLRELNIRLRAAFADAAGMSDDEALHCRWLAMGMQSEASGLLASQQALVEELKAIVDFARDRNLEDVVGYCMAASQGVGIGDVASDVMTDIREFVMSHAPVPAEAVDVAAGTGRSSLPLAKAGYEVALFEPALAFMESAYERAKMQGIDDAITGLICGTFKDLPKVKDDAYDVSVCIGSVLYAHPRQAAEDVVSNLSRISSRVVVVDVASKYGLILQLGAEGAKVSAGNIERLLNTGVTPPASAQNGHVVYSCFSSDELCTMLRSFGPKVEDLIGYGSPGSLDQATAEMLPACELERIEGYLQAENTPVNLFPNILALCVKE